ncbi:hypothetical protein [Plantactinospora sp. WMMB782]|uniref:hypothetical protein n=1 Tax=Plantactinospora sp. WMMB782 TaxID=3404121 RepID=UPI003B93FBE2
MDAFILRVLADVAAGRVYFDSLGNVRVTPETNVDPADEPRYIRIVRELLAACPEVDAEQAGSDGLQRLRLVVPDGYTSATVLTCVSGAFEAVAR